MLVLSALLFAVMGCSSEVGTAGVAEGALDASVDGDGSMPPEDADNPSADAAHDSSVGEKDSGTFHDASPLLPMRPKPRAA
jgi:hypothetical protein